MRSIKSGLIGFAVAALLGAFVVVGCSADGGDFIDPSPSQSSDSTEPTTQLPPTSNSDDNDDDDDDTDPHPSSSDGGVKKDGGSTKKPDAGKDAGPPPPEAGDACTTVDQTMSRLCGKCGRERTRCQDIGGKLQWSAYGPCESQSGECTPGETATCGNCGTKTCSNACGWGACTGQPMNSCTPGAIMYDTAGCPGGGYVNRTCGAACQWGTYSTTCEVPITPNKMTISATTGAAGLKTQQWTLQTETVAKPTISCNGLSTVSVRYIPVEVTNGTSKTAEISAYHSKTASNKEFDTAIWIYNGNGLPMTDAERGACVGKVADSCIAGNPCNNVNTYNFAGLDKISIPPGGKILVYSAAFGSSTDVGDGTINLNLRTDVLK